MSKAIRVVALVLVLAASLNAIAALTDSTATSYTPYVTPPQPPGGAVINGTLEYTTVYLYTNMTTYNSSFTYCSVAPIPPAGPAGTGTGAITIYGCPTQSIQIPEFSAVAASNTSLSNCLCKGSASRTEQSSDTTSPNYNSDCGAVVLGNNVNISTVNKTGGTNAADTTYPTIGSGQPTVIGMSITGVQCLVPVQMYVSTAFLKSIEVAKGVTFPATPVCSGSQCPPVVVPPTFQPTQFVWTIGSQSITVLLSYNGSLPVLGLPQSACAGATGTAVCPFNLAYDVFDNTTKPNDGTLTQAQVNIIIPPGTEYSGTTITFPMCGLGPYPAGYTNAPATPPSC
jgi:hypothetical protein